MVPEGIPVDCRSRRIIPTGELVGLMLESLGLGVSWRLG